MAANAKQYNKMIFPDQKIKGVGGANLQLNTSASLNSPDAQTQLIASDGIINISTVGAIKGNPITATAASALTPAESDVVFVSDTNGTFTSIGYWQYKNSAWAAM